LYITDAFKHGEESSDDEDNDNDDDEDDDEDVKNGVHFKEIIIETGFFLFFLIQYYIDFGINDNDGIIKNTIESEKNHRIRREEWDIEEVLEPYKIDE